MNYGDEFNICGSADSNFKAIVISGESDIIKRFKLAWRIFWSK